MLYYTHHFEGEIDFHGVGKKRLIMYKVLFMPLRFERELPFDLYPRLRIEGEIAEVPVRGAWIPVGDGRRYFIVSPEIKKQSGFDVGDRVEMFFRVDDQNHVDVPSKLQLALDVNPTAHDRWKKLTPGKKRMFAFHVLSAKTAPTEARRVDEAISAIKLGLTLRELKNEDKKRK
ncbi:MAG: YdeI/OmpD-associated family protein [Verrucomicrobiota bacterium]